MAGITEVPNTGTRHNIFPKYQIEFGPWVGGMNTADDPSLVSTSELSDCVNFMVNDDGTLSTRPSINKLSAQTDDYRNEVSALGSVVTIGNKLIPIVAYTGATSSNGGGTFGRITFWKYDGTWIPSFTSINLDPASGNFLQPYYNSRLIPKQVFQYNARDWVMFDRVGLASCTGSSGTLINFFGPANLAGTMTAGFWNADPVDTGFLRKALVFKDRIILATDNDIYWSDSNPSGIAADWSGTAPNTAGSLGFSRELGETIYDIAVYNDAVYIASSTKISRLSWSTNPGTDGLFTVIDNRMGGVKFEIYNGILYLLNRLGLYRLVNNYFVEVSVPIKYDFRNSVGPNHSERNFCFFGTTNAKGVSNSDLTFNMFRLSNFLLVGPTSHMSYFRATDDKFINPDQTGNLYFVLNLDKGTWTKWLFSPNSTDLSPMAGPCQPFMGYSAAGENPSSPSKFFWIGNTLVNGAFPSGSFMQKCGYYLSLSAQNDFGFDFDGVGDTGDPRKRIGGILRTSSVDLSNSNSWKRIQTSMLDGLYIIPVALVNGLFKFGYSISDPTQRGFVLNDIPIPNNNQDQGRLRFGYAIRARQFGFFYDSITDCDALSTSTTALSEGLSFVKRITAYVTLSRKQTAGGSSTN